MRTVSDIVFDVTGQVISFDAPEGRPSSVTSLSVFRWDVSDDDIAEAAVGTPAVEANPATTTDGAAGPAQSNPRNIPLTATTGCAVGRRYQIVSAAGLKEWTETESVTSGDSVTAKHPLHNDYASGSTYQSTRISATIDPTWVADETNLITSMDLSGNPMFRARWVYVVSSATYVADTYFNLVRYAGRHGVLPQDVESMSPGWLDRLPTDHQSDQGRRLIDEAHRSVKIDLHQIDISDSAIAESEVIDELVRYKAVELGEYAKALQTRDATAADMSSKRYQTRLDALLRIVSRVPVRDTTGAATPIVAVGLSRR